MVVSARCFRPKSSLVLDLVVTGGCFFDLEGEVFGHVVFDGPMDTSHTPSKFLFSATEDGNPTIIKTMAWVGDRELHWDNLENGIPSESLCLTYNGPDPDFKTARGKVVKPFGPICMGPCPVGMSAGRIKDLKKAFPDSPGLANL